MTCKKAFYIFATSLCLLSAGTVLGQNESRPVARRVSASARISWPSQSGASRYRLQVARDQGFSDMVIDRVVKGTGYLISGVPEGRYFWRVVAIGGAGGYSAPRVVRLIKPKPVEATETASTKKPSKPTAKGTRSKSEAPPPTGGRTARDAGTSISRQPARIPVAKPGNQPQATRVTSTPFDNPKTVSPARPLPENGGWRTVTGNISYPVAAHLRSSTALDLIGVNSSGTVYALDGANGSALWTTRLRSNAVGTVEASSNFAPIIFNGRDGLANIVIPSEGGVRALRGASGAEIWRTNLPGGVSGGIAAEAAGQSSSTIFVISGSGQEMLMLNGDTGAVTGKSALLARPFGQPVAFALKNTRRLAIVFEGGFVELRDLTGTLLRSVKLASPTTPPVFVSGPRGGLLLIGTQTGLMALDASDLRAIGRVAIEDDFPRGRLAVSDMEGDGAPEVVMITNRARVVAMNTTDGKIRWEANGATDAASAAFADVNGDGVLDVLVAAWPAFAVALSGRDGSLLWRADEDMDPAARMPFGSGRTLVTVPVSGGSNAIVAGTDSYRKAFRAVGLPRGAVRSGTIGAVARP
jgi:outer membrane protein assembly factor BamB